jgi:hypothetical protein
VADAGEIARWITDLADPDALTRSVSALKIYLEGAVLYSSTVGRWCTNAEFRKLVQESTAHDDAPTDSEKGRYVLGIAVQPEKFERIRAANGSPRLADVPPDQDAVEFEVYFDGFHYFDVITTRELGGSGAIGRYLQKLGEGIQQIEVLVSDVDCATEILRTSFSLEPIYPATRAGADGTRINFFLVPRAGGGKVLIEFVEHTAKS